MVLPKVICIVVIVSAYVCFLPTEAGIIGYDLLLSANINDNDEVDYYYCETSLPYNAPKSIV